jgi:hypothetical protein
MAVSQINSASIENGGVAQVDLASNIAGTGPAFIADTSAIQAVTAGVATKLNFDIASVNINSNFNTSTYRFTPTVAGYYQLSGAVQVQTVSTTCVATAILYKNGNVYMYGPQCPATSNNFPIAGVSGLMYLNGTTDFAEFYVISVGVSTNARGFNFQGVLVRAA